MAITNIRKQTFIEKLLHFAKVEGRGIRDGTGGSDDVRRRRLRPDRRALWPELTGRHGNRVST
jgi:hypothetical protein